MSLKQNLNKLDRIIYLLGILIRLLAKQEYIAAYTKKNSEDFNQEEFITSKQVCQILNCSSVTLWKIRKNGELPFTKFRNNIRFRKSDVTNYLLQK